MNLAQGFAAALKANGELLQTWRAGLDAARAAQLAELEANGIVLGSDLRLVGRSSAAQWVIVIVGVDAVGGAMPLETIASATTPSLQ